MLKLLIFGEPLFKQALSVILKKLHFITHSAHRAAVIKTLACSLWQNMYRKDMRHLSIGLQELQLGDVQYGLGKLPICFIDVVVVRSQCGLHTITHHQNPSCQVESL